MRPALRTYPQDSPQACARLVCLAMLVDGRMHPAEMNLLDAQGTLAMLRIPDPLAQQVLHQLCDDLAEVGNDPDWQHTLSLEPAHIRQALHEVKAPELRRMVMLLCMDMVRADRLLQAQEWQFIQLMLERWGFAPSRSQAPPDDLSRLLEMSLGLGLGDMPRQPWH